MSQFNCMRAGCRDVFHAFLVEKADFDGFLEIPILDYICEKPSKIIAFSKAVKLKEYDCWVHFFEDDVEFERIWNNPRKYLPILKKYKGVFSPDFVVYGATPDYIFDKYKKQGICILQFDSSFAVSRRMENA